MPVTQLNDLINPQVMADMIDAELDKQLKATNFYKIEKTLQGRAGDTITVPSWLYIGMAEDVPENAPVPLRQMKTESISYTVKKAALDVTLTDESVLSGYGDPVGQTNKQLRMSIQDRMEQDGIELLQGITPTTGHVLTLTSGAITYEDVVDALGMMEQYSEEQGIVSYLMVNSETAKTIRKSPQFIELPSPLRDQVLLTGVIGSISGASIVISNRLTDKEAYILTPQCLTAFMKRDINLITQYEMEYRRTRIGVDCHYVIALEDFDRVVAIRWA